MGEKSASGELCGSNHRVSVPGVENCRQVLERAWIRRVSRGRALERIGEDDPDEEDFDFARQIYASVVDSMVRVNFITCHYRVVG
jgi:hypothetical protein